MHLIQALFILRINNKIINNLNVLSLYKLQLLNKCIVKDKHASKPYILGIISFKQITPHNEFLKITII